MRKILLAAASLAAVAAPACAQPTDAARADARCVIVLWLYGAQTAKDNADARLGAAAGLGYFIGRLQGREPGIDLKARILTEAGRLNTPADLQPDYARCGGEMQGVSDDSNNLGAALKALADRKARQGG